MSNSEKNTIELNGRTILVTGSPGFIGANLVIRLLEVMESGHVISYDNMNDYYDPDLKKYRLGLIEEAAAASGAEHTFIEGSIADREQLGEVFEKYRPSVVVNLAAQAGVRYSIENPDVYMESNVTGFYNILELCRKYRPEHLVYASSSSVYGNNEVPFSEDDRVDQPVSLYAATKKTDELLAYTYSHLYGIPSTGLRFFTVYGPAGRPDMFYFSASKTLTEGGKIRVFNHGKCRRDFTYIDDIVGGIIRVLSNPPLGQDKTGTGIKQPPYALYNIGCSDPVNLMDFIEILFSELKNAGLIGQDRVLDDQLILTDMQPGDVVATYADCSALERDFGYRPETGIREGIRRFTEWFKGYSIQERGEEINENHTCRCRICGTVSGDTPGTES